MSAGNEIATGNDGQDQGTGTVRVKRGMAEMLKGGVIMDVVTPDQAKIAEDAGAVAVMALERVPADIRAQGGVSRMSDPDMIDGIVAAVQRADGQRRVEVTEAGEVGEGRGLSLSDGAGDQGGGVAGLEGERGLGGGAASDARADFCG